MRRAVGTAVLLCMMAVIATVCGCGSHSGPANGPEASEGKPPPPPPSHALYAIADMGTFDPRAIDTAAQVAGAVAVGAETHAALWAGGAVTDLGLAPFSRGYATNDSGIVVGGWRDSSGALRAFVWQAEQATRLEPLSGLPASKATGISDSLQVVGSSYEPEQSLPEATRACLWEQASGGWAVTDLGALTCYALSQAEAINDAGQIVGQAKGPGGQWQAGLWSQGTFSPLGTLGGGWSQATAISDGGQAVGYSATATGKTHAFLWQGGSIQDLGTLSSPYNESWAEDINDVATPQIVGNSYYLKTRPSRQYIYRACLWEGGEVYDLNSYLVPDGNTWVLQNAIAINDAGQIVAGGTRNGSSRYCLLTPR